MSSLVIVPSKSQKIWSLFIKNPLCIRIIKQKLEKIIKTHPIKQKSALPHPSGECLARFSLPKRDSAEQTIEYRLREGPWWGAVLRLFNCKVIKGVLSFRIYFGIARMKLIITALATLKQVQGDENRAVIPNSFRNRKIEVDKPESCRRKRDFHTLATLKRVQGDKRL